MSESSSAPPLDALLATKLYIPAPRPNRVPRPRLTERMELGTAGPLTLISAPAGFGKSTLLSEWAHAGDRRVAWVSLDEGDNDPVRFLSYLFTALRQLHPGLGEDALTALRHMQSPAPALFEPLLTGLLNDVHALGEDLVLVLDDYHVLESPAVHQAVQFVLDHLPPRLHLVIATRVDPPLPLSRLRARGQLTEIRAQDLRFTSAEAADFLNQAMGLSLSVGDVEALEERTEGWAVGLQMAALSLQGRQDVGHFIEHFTGSNRLSAPLCDAVTGRDDGQAVLEELDAANLFLIPLDDNRTWYRYHHLFGTLLRHQLGRKLGQAGVAALHEQASGWYAAHGHPEDALEHALAAGALDRATDLVTEHALPRLMRADAGTVIRWVRSLPLEWVHRRPKLRLSYAWALVAQLKLQEAEEHVREVERALAGAPDPELDAHAETLRGLLIRTAGRPREAIVLYQQALERLPAESFFLRGLISLELGTAYLTTDDFTAAERAFEAVHEPSQKAGNIFGILLGEWHLAEIQLNRGRLREALDLARRSRNRAEGSGREASARPAAAMAYAVMAEVQREWNDLPAAVELASQAWELGKRGEIANGLLGGSLAMVRVLQSMGDFPGALAALESAEEVMRRTGQRLWLQTTGAFRAGIQLRRSRVEKSADALDEVARWARDSGLLESWREDLAEGFLQLHQRDFAHLVLARFHLARGENGTARELLAALLPLAEDTGRLRSVIEILSLEALARDAQGDPESALAPLRRALALAEPEGFVRIFVDEGPDLAGLIERAAPGTVSPEYARRLLEAFGREGSSRPELPEPLPQPAVTLRKPQAQAEALSEREIEVLRLVAAGLSNAEAGRKLFIAPSTVKKHLENIYDKLGTRSRTQAIARAREIGLL